MDNREYLSDARIDKTPVEANFSILKPRGPQGIWTNYRPIWCAEQLMNNRRSIDGNSTPGTHRRTSNPLSPGGGPPSSPAPTWIAPIMTNYVNQVRADRYLLIFQ